LLIIIPVPAIALSRRPRGRLCKYADIAIAKEAN
jgi:hypothetical protein